MWIGALATALAAALWPAAAFAGLYETLSGEQVTWMPAPEKPAEPPKEGEAPAEPAKPTIRELFLTPPAKTKYFDYRVEPVVLIRTIFATTLEDKYKIPGQEEPLDSTTMQPSALGHREGFILDNVELGLKGRFNDSGLYYQLKMELAPREKNGNASADYLKDAYLGWNKYSVADIRIGRMKIPFSQANMKPTEDMPLINTPLANLLVPKRQIGAMVSIGDPWQVVKLRGGVFNSTELAVEQLLSFDQLAYVGRGEIYVDKLLDALSANFLDFEFMLGGGILHTEQNFDPSTQHRWRGIDGRLHLWIFTVEGEYVWKDFLLDDGSADQGYGWYADLTIHAWPTVIDVTGRIEQMDGDKEVRGFSTTLVIDELTPQKKRWITGGVTLHVAEQARFAANYVMREELEGFKFKNGMFMGMLQFNL